MGVERGICRYFCVLEVGVEWYDMSGEKTRSRKLRRWRSRRRSHGNAVGIENTGCGGFRVKIKYRLDGFGR